MEELNANLGSVESTAATLVPLPARLEGPPDAAMGHVLVRWRSTPMPHRLDLHFSRLLAAIPATMFVVCLLGWVAFDLPRPAQVVIVLLSALLCLVWFLDWRHAYWIEVASIDRRVRWGRGRNRIEGEAVVAAFQAEPQRSSLGQDSSWTVVAYKAGGQRVEPFGRAIRIPQRWAVRSAWLLNQALTAGERQSGAP